MEYYYTSSNHQDYPLNYPYNNQPYNDYHHNYNYSPSSFDESKSDTPGIPLKLNYEFPSYDEYGGYSNEPPIRYDQNYDNYTQFHSNPYEHFPAQSLTVYQYNSSYDHPFEFPAKKGSNFLDPVSTTGFVISYSNTEPKPDLEFEEFEEFDLRNFHGGYSIEETYGKPLPPSEEICYPPAKFDPTPPPPLSDFAEGEKNLNKTPELKEEEDQASEPKEDDDDDEEDEEEEEEHEEENRGVLIAPLPRMGDQAVNEEEEEEEDDEEEEEEENRGVLVAPPLLRKEDQGVNEAEEEEEESSNSEGYEEGEEEEEKRENLDGGRVEEKEIKRQIVPPGYGLQAMDLCEGVFGGYFPCLRKRSNQGSADQSSGNSNTISSGNNEDFSGDCWNTTVDYLFGDPDPYARALPDPIYGYHRYYPQQPISGQIDFGEDHSWMDNSSYYNYECNGGGY